MATIQANPTTRYYGRGQPIEDVRATAVSQVYQFPNARTAPISSGSKLTQYRSNSSRHKIGSSAEVSLQNCDLFKSFEDIEVSNSVRPIGCSDQRRTH